MRLHWPVMDRTLSTPPVRTELLDGVDNVEVRFLDSAGEWQLDWPPLQMNGPQRLVARPRAVEFAIELEGFRASVPARGDERLSTRAQQRGVAVLIAMLVVTVGTIIAVNLMWQGTLDLRRAESALATDQGHHVRARRRGVGGGHPAARPGRFPGQRQLERAMGVRAAAAARRRRHDHGQARGPAGPVQLEQLDQRPRPRRSDRAQTVRETADSRRGRPFARGSRRRLARSGHRAALPERRRGRRPTPIRTRPIAPPTR